MLTGYFYAQTARVQVIHNSADAAAEFVDVYLDATLLIPNFEFRTASAFIDAPAGVEIELSVAPANSTGVEDAIYSAPVTLTEDETYVVVADGIVSGSGYNPAPAFGLQIYPMGRETATDPANTDVLVHHGSTDAPTVDVVETGVGAGTIVDNIAYTEFQGYLELPSEDYILEVRTEDGLTTVASYQAPLATLGLEGAAAVVVASGFLDPSQNSDGAAFGLYAALPTGGALVMLPTFEAQTARVQVIHNSADAAAEFVDVYLNDALLIPNFEFRTASPFVDAPAGIEIELSVAPAGSTGVEDAIYTAPVTLAANETYIVVADGIVSGSGYNPPQPFGLQVYAMGREMATDPANTDVLVHHGSTDAPAVDVVETGVGAGIIVDDISYTEFQGYLELPTADYTIQINTADGSTGVAAYEAPLSTLGLDGVALAVIASGFLDPSQNSDGAVFGLFVALPTGGDLLPLPTATLGVEDFDQNAFVMYPNPVNNQLNFEFSTLDIDELKVSITDMQGRIVLNNQIKTSTNTIDVSGLSTGLYQVIIMDENDILMTKKLIKN
tara:strand:+ start:1419 stop:3083 length:1665 start_codon:yes stop_codon:yes gene_type:complete